MPPSTGVSTPQSAPGSDVGSRQLVAVPVLHDQQVGRRDRAAVEGDGGRGAPEEEVAGLGRFLGVGAGDGAEADEAEEEQQHGCKHGLGVHEDPHEPARATGFPARRLRPAESVVQSERGSGG